MSRLTLLARFSLISLAVLVVAGIALGRALTQHLEQQAIEQQVVGVSALVPPIIGPHITDELLANGAQGKSYDNIEAAFSYLGGSGLVRIRIWNKAGMLIYSDEPSLVGQRLPASGEVMQAFNGIHAAVKSPVSDSGDAFERGYGQLLEVYIPLRMAGQNDVSAVFQGYYSIDDLQERIDYTNGFLWSSLGIGFLFLYVSLFTIVRNASQRLIHQSEENAHLYHQAQQRLVEREEAERQTQRQVARLKALRNIDVAISSSLDLRLTLHIILDQVCTQLHVDGASVLLLNERTPLLEYAAGRGFRSRGIDQSRVRLGEGHAGQAALRRQPSGVVKITNTGDLIRDQLLREEGFVSYSAAPLIAKGQVQGVLEIFHRTLLEPDDEWLHFFEALAGQAAIAVENATLFEDLQHTNMELALAYDNTLEGWSRALDLRDKETEGHSQRVTEMTLGLARAMGVNDADIVHIRRGALLHDIGKMGIPDSILLKPGPLTDDEWRIMRRHPVYAYELISPISFLRPALEIPYCHHERWDGTGYPRGLKGEQIPLSARIFAVVDVWDALRSDRPYRTAKPKEVVLPYIQEQSGLHFDPGVVESFMRMQMADLSTPRSLDTVLR